MPRITPHLWFDHQAEEAAGFYATTFPDSRITDVTTIHDTPSGDCPIVSFELCGQPFQAISAGPLFTFNPSVSFAVACDTAEEVDQLWGALSDGGRALMPLGEYPFSGRYGWLEDRYGLSWQLMLTDVYEAQQRITPTLMFVGDVHGRAEEAVRLYASVFPDSEVGEVMRYGPGMEPDVEGTVQYVHVFLDGQQFAAMDSAHDHGFTFNEAVSFIVSCATQEEIDRYSDALSAVPEAEQCGWIEDRFGLSWQIVPADLDPMMQSADEQQLARVTQALLAMKRLDIAELRRAYEGHQAEPVS